jgi:hypothetical protein
MTLSIYGIPHVRNLKKNIKNNICVLPIMFYGKGISFGIAENYREDICVVSWYSCREVFHDDYPFSNHIFINHSIGAHNLLCNFVNDLESIFGIKKKSECFKTNRKTVSLLLLSSFWRRKIMFSLLTLFIRYALKNKAKTFDFQKLKRCKYLEATSPAINLLIEGKSKYYGKLSSWYDQFNGLTYEESVKYLR